MIDVNFTDPVRRRCLNTLFQMLHNILDFGTHLGAHVENEDLVIPFLVGVSRMIVLGAFQIFGKMSSVYAVRAG